MKGVVPDTGSPGSAGGTACLWRRAWIAIGLAVAFVGLLAGLNSCLVPAAFAQDLQDEPLVDVQIEGNVTILTSAIAKYIKTRPNRPASEKQIREDVRSLYATRWFFSVEPRYRHTDEGLVLVFKVLERPMVRRVEYHGNKKIKTKELAAHTGLKKGSSFDVSANRESARRLESLYHEKGFTFATVELEQGDSQDDRNVIFRIHEGLKVRVTRIKFEGNKSFRGPLLKTKLRTKTAIAWSVGGLYDPATIPDDISALKQYYQALGYFDVAIEHRTSFSKNRSRVQITYLIDEGVRYKLRQIEILGTKFLSEEDIHKDLTLAVGDPFNARFLNKDLDGIKKKYGELGRVFAKIDAVPRFLEQEGEVDLVYKIDEDRVYRFGAINVHIQGDHPHTKLTTVYNLLRIQPGDLVDPNMIRLSKRRLEGSQLFERGKNGPRITITVKPEKTNDSRRSAKNFRGQSAAQPRPRRGSLRRRRRRRGNGPQSRPYTKSSKRSERETSPPIQNDALPFIDPGFDNPSFYVRADRRAERSQTIRGQSFDGPFRSPGNPIFDNNPQGDPFNESINTPPEGVIIGDVFPTEARTGRLMFGVGVNSDAGMVGSIILSEQNFDIGRPPRSFRDLVNGTAWRGGGQRFRLEAIPGSVVSRYLINWTDPYFLNTNYSLGVSGFFYKRFFHDWNERRGGGRLTVGKQLTPTVSISSAVRLEEVVLSDPDIPTPALLAAAVGSSFLSTVRLSMAHDTRDSPFLPAEGHFIQLSYEQAFGNFTYPRAKGEARQYFTLYSRVDGGGRHTLALSGQVAWTDVETPIFERYYAGGFQTFRGFEFRGVSPRMFGVRVGGRWMALGTVEYMAPLMANEMIQGVVFTDLGTVENDVGFDEFRATAGLGLRVTVAAMGPAPLAFDFAFPIFKEDADDMRIFSFYVGMTR